MSTCKNKVIHIIWFFAMGALLIVGSANAQVDYALMLQQTPAKGGTVSPDAGVHSISANGNVTVTATPSPGYQFVYWLGDVTNPTASTTVVSVNAPKIVVAVFERNAYQEPFGSELVAASGGGGGDSLIPNNGGQVGGGGGGISPASGSAKMSSSGGPNNGDPVPTPTPEPATIAMLALGVMGIISLHHKKVQHIHRA